jgi:hypothetical protein
MGGTYEYAIQMDSGAVTYILIHTKFDKDWFMHLKVLVGEGDLETHTDSLVIS